MYPLSYLKVLPKKVFIILIATPYDSAVIYMELIRNIDRRLDDSVVRYYAELEKGKYPGVRSHAKPYFIRTHSNDFYHGILSIYDHLLMAMEHWETQPAWTKTMQGTAKMVAKQILMEGRTEPKDDNYTDIVDERSLISYSSYVDELKDDERLDWESEFKGDQSLNFYKGLAVASYHVYRYISRTRDVTFKENLFLLTAFLSYKLALKLEVDSAERSLRDSTQG